MIRKEIVGIYGMYVHAIFILQKSCNIPLRNGKEINKIEKSFCLYLTPAFPILWVWGISRR